MILISIHAPREGGDGAAAGPTGASKRISIHAPREGGDDTEELTKQPHEISIHAPREGGDTGTILEILRLLLFQSTPPARGATFFDSHKIPDSSISIHAPREGGDVNRKSLHS